MLPENTVASSAEMARQSCLEWSDDVSVQAMCRHVGLLSEKRPNREELKGAVGRNKAGSLYVPEQGIGFGVGAKIKMLSMREKGDEAYWDELSPVRPTYKNSLSPQEITHT